jgi:hypothetical protein
MPFAHTGGYIALAAADTLAQFMVNGSPDDALFDNVVGGVIAQAEAVSAGQRVAAFGEMVALLCGVGNAPAPIRLERLWNELATRPSFSLFCAYPFDRFADDVEGDALLYVCAEHQLSIPRKILGNPSNRLSP